MDRDSNGKELHFAKLTDLKVPVTFRMQVSRPYLLARLLIRGIDPSLKGRANRSRSQNC